MRGTATPAKILGYEGTVGTLKPGANADIAVFELRDGTFPLRDSDHNTINARPVPEAASNRESASPRLGA
jgi:imidazolonepropionase-like amidohydrolase